MGARWMFLVLGAVFLVVSLGDFLRHARTSTVAGRIWSRIGALFVAVALLLFLLAP